MKSNTHVHRPALALAGAALVATTFVAPAAPADEPAPRTTSTLSVKVSSFRNQKGSLGCRLYRSAAGFPEGTSGTTEKRTAVTGVTGRCDYADLPAGTYAVSVMHDENDDQKLDKNFLGIPTEGYGVSNNHTHAMSAPTWDESMFVVGVGKDVVLAITLRY